MNNFDPSVVKVLNNTNHNIIYEQTYQHIVIPEH